MSTRPTTPKPAQPADDYDRMVDWNARLARELPFFRRLFAERGVRSVLDVGCGSGMHAVAFAEWGLRVVGADPSESMLAQARVNARRAGADVTFLHAGFGELAGLVDGTFGAVTCLGNALPHVVGAEGLHAAITDFAAVLDPGGLLVLHLLNHDRLLARRPRVILPTFRETPEGEKVYLRVLTYPEDASGIVFDFLTLTRAPGAAESPPPTASIDFGDPGRDAGGWEVAARRSLHTALPVSLLAPELSSAGFVDVVAYGDHAGSPFDADTDESVVLTATSLGETRV